MTWCPVSEPRPHKIPESVLVIVHTPEREVLLIRRADSAEYWQCVTGSKDSLDEDPRDTAWREVLEETGIDARPGTPLHARLRDWGLSNVYEIWPQWLHRYAPGVRLNTEHVFSLCVPRGTPVTLSPREHIDLCWLPRLEAADRCYSFSNAEAILLLPEFAA